MKLVEDMWYGNYAPIEVSPDKDDYHIAAYMRKEA